AVLHPRRLQPEAERVRRLADARLRRRGLRDAQAPLPAGARDPGADPRSDDGALAAHHARDLGGRFQRVSGAADRAGAAGARRRGDRVRRPEAQGGRADACGRGGLNGLIKGGMAMRKLLWAAAAGFAASVSVAAAAAEYPSKPINLLVAYGA